MKIMTTIVERKLTAYDFMRCLFATLAKNKRSIINKTALVKEIYGFREHLQQTSDTCISLFDDIEFRTGIDNSIVSYDINNGISNLQTFGVVGKLNPTYEKLFIYLTEQEADDILSNYAPEVKTAIATLANQFVTGD